MSRPGRANRWAAWLEANGPGRFQLASKTGWDAFVNTAPRADLRVLSRTEMAALSTEELEDYTEARMVWNANLPTVKTHQLTAAFAVIDQVMASNRRDADRLRGSVVVDAAPGLGKTTIATRYARDFHRRAYRRHGPKTASGSQRLPVAFVPLSAGMTLKGLNQKILAFYGHPAANRASSTRLGALAVDCVTECETQLVVIDDLHFVDFRHRHGQEVSNHLKGLANEMPVTFIYVGVRLREKRFFDEGDPRLRRRLRPNLPPRDPLRGRPVRHRHRRGACAAGPTCSAPSKPISSLPTPDPGMLTDHAKELHRRTQGHIASLTNLIDRACYLAIVTGIETITADLLAADDLRQCRRRPLPRRLALPASPIRADRRLRAVSGGYDLDPLPIHVATPRRESVVSWLRRVSGATTCRPATCCAAPAPARRSPEPARSRRGSATTASCCSGSACRRRTSPGC